MYVKYLMYFTCCQILYGKLVCKKWLMLLISILYILKLSDLSTFDDLAVFNITNLLTLLCYAEIHFNTTSHSIIFSLKNISNIETKQTCHLLQYRCPNYRFLFSKYGQGRIAWQLGLAVNITTNFPERLWPLRCQSTLLNLKFDISIGFCDGRGFIT